MRHRLPVTVYYEDTDMAGIVYHANYLRYIERARSHIAEELGIDQRAMLAQGHVFAVVRIEADYLGAARLGDRLTVESAHAPVGRVRWRFDQSVARGADVIFRAKVIVACMTVQGRPVRLPGALHSPRSQISPG